MCVIFALRHYFSIGIVILNNDTYCKQCSREVCQLERQCELHKCAICVILNSLITTLKKKKQKINFTNMCTYYVISHTLIIWLLSI